ncbi:homocysteine-responsive endoplasmic reticulum-resident ubiquitin-like domain member 2 protein [Trichoplusia ni]|uniref:Homocysteine-responsive endoplasmic reticulum-resident ubiquitin-like domain member 2 protein n=1 Tax=Trichoplusia ni TaxID=7111 RepID=A0A7E5WJN8_TRINI|nr:homocysteine-responsive endoplasmic reticulum-resident ubiquitin-like domain member 2 protein [Trichoplusia ni]
MIPDNVTLIVKAPNQQIEDQNIECESSWTVRQLKGHLAEVYPSKPKTEEQKIIYSGQLLDDNTILKDVLRTYESQIAHTMHLVCTPTRKIEPTVDPNPGLRRRVVTETVNQPERVTEPPRPETRQNDQNHNVEMQNYLTSFVNNYGRVPPYPNYNFGEGYLPVPNDPAQLANHMMMMQQAYLQYMQQYANMWQAAGGAPPAPVPAEAPPAAVETPAPVEEPDEALAARDWLDHLYAASRLAILFSLVYLYGSPARLFLVMLLAAAGYLHQIGFFRDLHVNPAENQRRNEQPNQAADNRNQPADEAAPPPTNNDNQQSLLSVTWMIFISFFASLIPDTN